MLVAVEEALDCPKKAMPPVTRFSRGVAVVSNHLVVLDKRLIWLLINTELCVRPVLTVEA